MSKKSLKKIIINNKINTHKIIEKKKALLNSFQYDNNNIEENYIDEELYPNFENRKIVKKIDISYDSGNKENDFTQNIKPIGNKSIQDINYYLIKKNNNNINKIDNEYEYKKNTYKKLHKLNYHKIKKDNMILTYPNKPQTKNTVINLNIQKAYNNNNYNNYRVIKNNKTKNYNNNSNNNYKNNEGYLTSRLIENNNNQKIIQLIKNKYLFDNKALTDRNYDIIYKNNYLLPENKSGKKTLILDLDETLIHSSFKPFNIKDEIEIKIKTPQSKNIFVNNNNHYIIYMLKRPYVGIFLSIVCDIFEVVIFTASVSDYANSIIDEIDTEKKIKYRLFRDHCIKYDKDKYIKNLYCLGRDLKNVIIIDNNPLSYTLNIENGIPISTWETNKNDNELIKLIPLLQYISQKNIFDVRPIIKKVVINNKINYDEINKLINYKNKETIDNNEDKKSDIKENKIYKNKVINSLYKKLESFNDNNTNNNNDSYYLNYMPITNNQKILKNIYINRGQQLFIKKLKNISENENKYREKSENQKSKSFNCFQEKDQKDNNLINKIRNYNLSEKYLILKRDKKNEYENENENENSNNNNKKTTYEKKGIKYYEKVYNISKKNKTFIENKKAEIPIPIPIPNNNNYVMPMPIYLKNKKKLISKNQNIISLNKNDSKKHLIKNNSDYGYINKNNSKENIILINKLKYPTLKNLLYHKIFYNNYKDMRTRNKSNKKLTSVSINNSVNKHITTSTDIKPQKKPALDIKKDINTRDITKKQNYSMENYLNNKFHLKISNENLNNFILKLKMKNQQKMNESKNNNINTKDNSDQGNNSLIIYRNFFNIFKANNPLKESNTENKIVKHSFSLINKKKDKDYMSIINRYRRVNN